MHSFGDTLRPISPLPHSRLFTMASRDTPHLSIAQVIRPAHGHFNRSQIRNVLCLQISSTQVVQISSAQEFWFGGGFLRLEKWRKTLVDTWRIQETENGRYTSFQQQEFTKKHMSSLQNPYDPDNGLLESLYDCVVQSPIYSK